MKNIELRIAGVAGQGIVLLGKLLGAAATLQGKQATASFTIGPEVRGGISLTDIVISDDGIDYPRVEALDCLVALAQKPYEANIGNPFKDKAAVFFDSTLVTKTDSLKLPHYGIAATDAAIKEFKDPIFGNMVMLACVVRLTKIVSLDAINRALRGSLDKDSLPLNLKAFELGYQLSKKIRFP